MNGHEISAIIDAGAVVEASASEQESPSVRTSWSPSVRVLLALLLLVAAGLKSYQLIDKPVPAVFILGSRWLSIVAIEWELFLGLWLLSGVQVFHAWWGAIVTFGLFSVVSLVKAVSGDSSCGCFGYVEVSPWITLVIDVSAVGVLLWARSRCAANGAGSSERLLGDGSSKSQFGWPGLDRREAPTTRSPLDRETASSPLVWVASFLTIGGPVAIWVGLAEPSRLDSTAGILGTGDLVILEPEQWVGERFPLLDYLNIEADLSTGFWAVLLYHETCTKCQDVLPRYMDLANRTNRNHSDPSSPRLALVETSVDGIPTSRNGPWEAGKLSGEREWFVTPPVQVNIRDGVVTDVLDESEISVWLKDHSGFGFLTSP